MRASTTTTKLYEFMKAFAAKAKGPGVVYFTGGATALDFGIRAQTIDVDIKLDPEPAYSFEAIAQLKEELKINVELAAPDQFIPPLPGWRERSLFIQKIGQVEFRHYDLYSQALSKIERGHSQDINDVRALLSKGLIDKAKLNDFFTVIESGLVRYPAINPVEFALKVKLFCEQ